MQVVLVMFRGDGERRSFSVVRNMTVIGRREDCDLRIPLGDVSRKHCRLVRTDEGIRIEDLGSSHGTTVNGQPVKEMELSPGDTIGVGPVNFVVQIDGVPGDDEIVSPDRRAAEAAVAADDSVAGHHHGAEAHADQLPAEEEFPLDELAAEDVSLEEVPLDEVALDQVALEEAALEEAPLEEVPLEEAVPEETALHEAGLEEVPLQEQVPGEELSLEEVPLEEVAEQTAAAGHGAEEMTLEDVSMEEVPAGSNDKTIDRTAAEAGIAEDFTASPSAGADELEELDWMEVTPAAAAPRPPALPPSPAAVPPAAHHEGSPAEASAEEPAAAGDEWDFVVEETEADHGEMHVDFEESHHGQPHA
jgi:pSer/pThr/pTyr-binding forkhead associated (FHA) protein